MARKQTAKVVELSAEQEALAQRVYEKVRGKADEELLAMVRLMMSKADHEFFGPGEFELRDKLNQFGAMVVAEAANERAKKGVPR
jgi:hypothetical protein